MGMRFVSGDSLEEEGIRERFRSEDLVPLEWSNGPGDTYGWHAHPYHKVLYCVEGSITFEGRQGRHAMGPGDRLDIEPGTEHAATVGPDGVRCMEASR